MVFPYFRSIQQYVSVLGVVSGIGALTLCTIKHSWERSNARPAVLHRPVTYFLSQ